MDLDCVECALDFHLDVARPVFKVNRTGFELAPVPIPQNKKMPKADLEKYLSLKTLRPTAQLTQLAQDSATKRNT